MEATTRAGWEEVEVEWQRLHFFSLSSVRTFIFTLCRLLLLPADCVLTYFVLNDKTIDYSLLKFLSWAACGINWNSLRASRIGTRIFFLSQFARPPDRDSPIFFQSQLFSSIHRRLPAISNVFFKVPIELKTGELKKKKKGTYYFAIKYCMSTIFSPRSSSRVFESFVYCCKYFLP